MPPPAHAAPRGWRPSEAEARWMVMSIAGISGPLSWPCCCGTICFAKSRRPLRAKVPRGLRGRRPSAGPMPLLGASATPSAATEQQHGLRPYRRHRGRLPRPARLHCKRLRSRGGLPDAEAVQHQQARGRHTPKTPIVPGRAGAARRGLLGWTAAAAVERRVVETQVNVHRSTHQLAGKPRKPCTSRGHTPRGFPPRPDISTGGSDARPVPPVAALWRAKLSPPAPAPAAARIGPAPPLREQRAPGANTGCAWLSERWRTRRRRPRSSQVRRATRRRPRPGQRRECRGHIQG